jgi:fatty acid desaturase
VDDPVIWIIIIAFYAPLHFMLPVLFLFIVGDETEVVRKQLIRSAVIDAALSMVVAFALAILLVSHSQIALAMVVLVLFMLAPFIRILRNRRVIK